MSGEQARVGEWPDVVHFSKTVSEADVYGFAGITGDFHPLHIDAQYAASQPVGQRVAHGALTLGLMSATAAKWMTQRGVDGLSYGYDRVRFIRPVHFGDTITVSYAPVTPNPDDRGITCGVEARNQHGDVVSVARHIIWSAR